MSTELAWAAGFFDGEGTFIAVRTNDRGTPRVQLLMSVPQKDCRPLDRFQRAVGAGHIYRRRFKGNHYGSDVWVWQVMGRQACCDAMLKLEPYLSEPKREQISRALDTLEQYRAGLTWNRGRKNKRTEVDNGVASVPQCSTHRPHGMEPMDSNLEEVQ